MSKVIDLEQVFDAYRLSEAQRAPLRQAAQADPLQLRSYPAKLQQVMYLKAQVQQLCDSYLVERGHVYHPPVARQNPPDAGQLTTMIQRAWYETGAQQPTWYSPTQQQAQVQQAQVRRGPQYSVQQAPDPELKQAVRNLQRELADLPNRLAAAVQRSQVRAPQPPAQVQRSQAATSAPQLPVSPITGRPSTLTQMVRRSVGLDGGPTSPPPLPNPSRKVEEYYQERQIANQMAAQKAAYEQSLPVSPITGRPSSITALARKSVGL